MQPRRLHRSLDRAHARVPTARAHLLGLYPCALARAAVKKRMGERGLLPVTVKQIMESKTEGDDNEFVIDDREAKQITIVGQITDLQTQVRRRSRPLIVARVEQTARVAVC